MPRTVHIGGLGKRSRAMKKRNQRGWNDGKSPQTAIDLYKEKLYKRGAPKPLKPLKNAGQASADKKRKKKWQRSISGGPMPKPI